MSAKFPHLAASHTPEQTPYKFAHLIRQPGDPVESQIIPFKALTLEVRKWLASQISATTRDTTARSLVIQGKPGEGKSEGALVAALQAGFSVSVVPAGMFASENEGGATELLDAYMAECERWSAEQQKRLVVIINDIDMSIMNLPDKMGATINSNLLLERFHFLADNRHLHRNFDGSNIGFIVTVNDASNLRASLYREGRGVWHDHEPSIEDKTNIAWRILDPQTTTERDLVGSLTWKFRHQPVAFWKALHHAIRAQHIQRAISRDINAAAELLGRRVPLNPDIAWACARQLRGHRVRNYLARRGYFRR